MDRTPSEGPTRWNHSSSMVYSQDNVSGSTQTIYTSMWPFPPAGGSTDGVPPYPMPSNTASQSPQTSALNPGSWSGSHRSAQSLPHADRVPIDRTPNVMDYSGRNIQHSGRYSNHVGYGQPPEGSVYNTTFRGANIHGHQGTASNVGALYQIENSAPSANILLSSQQMSQQSQHVTPTYDNVIGSRQAQNHDAFAGMSAGESADRRAAQARPREAGPVDKGKAPAIPVSQQDQGRSFSVATTPYPRHIMSSEVWSFAHSSDFKEVVKELFLPLNVPQWQQAVRAAVLIVGTIERWADEQGGRKSHYISNFSERYSPAAWVHHWLSAQPHCRFNDTRFSSATHPNSLLYPNRTDPSDWACFLTTSRQTIFSALLGLKGVFPHGSRSLQSSMTEEHWSAWLNDVMWVLFQILHHIETIGKPLLYAFHQPDIPSDVRTVLEDGRSIRAQAETSPYYTMAQIASSSHNPPYANPVPAFDRSTPQAMPTYHVPHTEHATSSNGVHNSASSRHFLQENPASASTEDPRAPLSYTIPPVIHGEPSNQLASTTPRYHLPLATTVPPDTAAPPVTPVYQTSCVQPVASSSNVGTTPAYHLAHFNPVPSDPPAQSTNDPQFQILYESMGPSREHSWASTKKRTLDDAEESFNKRARTLPVHDDSEESDSNDDNASPEKDGYWEPVSPFNGPDELGERSH